jgi:hypothetical protein
MSTRLAIVADLFCGLSIGALKEEWKMLSHAEPIWVFALLAPLYSWHSFCMAFDEFTEVVDRSLLRAAAYLTLGIVSVATPLIIAIVG